MSGKDIYILSQMLPGNIWTDPLSVAVYTNKFSIRQFARERGGKCFHLLHRREVSCNGVASITGSRLICCCSAIGAPCT